MKKTLLILRGLPASGKSTFAKGLCERYPDLVRVCRDDLRNMRVPYWFPKQERLITSWEQNCARVALEHGYSVVLDATNLNNDFLDDMITYLKLNVSNTFEIKTKDFNTPLEECIRRDSLRENPVGEDVIRNMHKKYLK